MRYALVDGERKEATKGAKGICPGCGAEVVAKCGTRKMPHWAHKSKIECDPWWKNKGEWHQNWQDKFPTDWQEIWMTDEQTEERHIADVRTPDGIVIEFQHSAITPEEQLARERFYKNMSWVVDPTVRDYRKFIKSREFFTQLPLDTKLQIFSIRHPEECFPEKWTRRGVPVLFDYNNTEATYGVENPSVPLCCLLPIDNVQCFFFNIPTNVFLSSIIRGNFTLGINLYKNKIINYIMQVRKYHRLIYSRFPPYRHNKQRRRF